jgi:rubrerythrin
LKVAKGALRIEQPHENERTIGGMNEPDVDPAEHVPAPEDLGGDPVCWAPRVCQDCGLFVPKEPPTQCPRCGAMVGID